MVRPNAQRPCVGVTSALKRAALALLLFAAVYAPAFGLVAWFHPRLQVTVPLIIVVSAGLAALNAASSLWPTS